jgi:cardiolipin synthase
MMKRDPSFHRDPTDVRAMREQLVEAGVEILDTEIDYSEIAETGEPELDAIAREIKETVVVDAFHVDHRKIVTIDGRIAYCGSANFGAQYQYRRPFDPTKGAKDEADAARAAGEPEPWWKWHDGFVRFEGSIVRGLDKVFRERWRLGGGADFAPLEAELAASPRGVCVRSARVLKNEPSSRPNEIREVFVERILAAEKTIFIENPFLYHPTIVETLLAAKKARPALRVTLIVPARDWNPNEFTQDAQQHHYAAYLEAGIDVFEYRNHFNHLKLATFDGRWAIIGSANLNFRSLEDDKDFEACVLVDSDEFARGIDRDVRDEDVRRSKRVVPADVHGASLHALRARLRDPRTLMMIAAREL